MKLQTDILKDMTSVMIFEASDSQAVTNEKFDKWLRQNNRSAVGDRNVPCAAETRRMLHSTDVV